MNILNLYYSATGNTEKVAVKIQETAQGLEHSVDTIKITPETKMDIIRYDFAFVGSGVYSQLPGEPVMEVFRSHLQEYILKGEIKPASPRRPLAKTVVYCTYGGAHTGMNEAYPQ